MPERSPAVALVTGVTGEIGQAVTRRLWAAGVGVLGIYGSSKARAERLRREADAGGHEVWLHAVDFRDADGARRALHGLARSRHHAWRRISAFIGLAGHPARGVWRQPFSRHDARLFETIYRVDTLSHAWTVQALAATLRKRRGRVVLMSSSAGFTGDDLGIPFALAKAANVALVKSLARILAPEVSVNGLAPGAIETAWLDELTPAQRRRAREVAALKRFGKPEEVAELCFQLAFGGFSFLTGQVLIMDGGANL